LHISNLTSGFDQFHLSVIPACLKRESSRLIGAIFFICFSLVMATHSCLKKIPLSPPFSKGELAHREDFPLFEKEGPGKILDKSWLEYKLLVV
jgi:hypothetical protein